MKTINKLIGITALSALLPATAMAASVPLIDNQVIIDNNPFFSIGAEDGLGVGNYALNHPGFIDIPYAIFDFGSTASVGSAVLSWNFNSLYGGSGAAQISLYAGNDADGLISVNDRFNGSFVTVSSFSGGETWSVDVTALVNSSLSSGQYFAARLEAVLPPSILSGYYGGQFFAPSLEISAVPEPETYAMLLAGLGILGFSMRCKKQAV